MVTWKNTCNIGELNGLSWTNNNLVINSVTFIASQKNRINTITVNYSATQPTKPIAKVNSIKELKTLESGTKATLTLTDGNEGSMARVLYVFGTGNTQEAYVRDTTGAICFYGINPNVPFVSNPALSRTDYRWVCRGKWCSMLLKLSLMWLTPHCLSLQHLLLNKLSNQRRLKQRLSW